MHLPGIVGESLFTVFAFSLIKLQKYQLLSFERAWYDELPPLPHKKETSS